MLNNRIFIERRNSIPKIRMNPDFDNYFFPFFPASGATAAELDQDISYNNTVFEQVFTGKNTIVMKWLNSEDSLIAYDKNTQEIVENPEDYNSNLILKRQIRIGTFYLGKILNHTQKTEFSKKGAFLKQGIKTTASVYFNNPWIWNSEKNLVKQQNIYLFWKIPEINDNDIFYIDSINIILNQYGKYVCHIVNFGSLNEKFNEIGLFLDQKIQFSAPGQAPILPSIERKLKNKNNEIVDLLFFEKDKVDSSGEFIYEEILNSKKVYINSFFYSTQKGVKSIQIEFEGLVGLISINIFGYEKEENELLVNRSIPIFLHKNIPVIVSPLQKTTQYNDQLFFLGEWNAFMRFWFQNWKQDQGLFFNPKASRDEQGVVENKTQTWNHILTEDRLLKTVSAQQNEKQNFEVVGFQNLALNPFCALFNEKLKWDSTENKIIPVNKKKISVNLAEFLNLNRYLNDIVENLEFGIYQLKNSKGLYTAIASDVFKFLGIGLGGFGKIFSRSATPFRSGLTVFNQIAETAMSWLPNELFTSKNILKISSSFNFAISKEFLEFLAASLPKYSVGKINPAYIPFDLFKEGNYSAWSNLIGTHNLNQSFNFELTDKAFLFNSNKRNVEETKTSNLIIGTHKIPSDSFETAATDSSFVIQMMEIKCLGFRNAVITFRDENNEILNYFKIQTQNKFSGNAKDINTRIWFDWSRDNNISVDEKFRSSFLNKAELQNYSLEKILDAKNKDEFNEKLLNNVPQTIYFKKKNIVYTTKKNLVKLTYWDFKNVQYSSEINSILIDVPENKNFWELWENALNEKKENLKKLFNKISFNFEIFTRHRPRETKFYDLYVKSDFDAKKETWTEKNDEFIRLKKWNQKVENCRRYSITTGLCIARYEVNYELFKKILFQKKLLNKAKDFLNEDFLSVYQKKISKKITWNDQNEFEFTMNNSEKRYFTHEDEILFKKTTKEKGIIAETEKIEYIKIVNQKTKTWVALTIRFTLKFDATAKKISLKTESINARFLTYSDFLDKFENVDWWIGFEITDAKLER